MDLSDRELELELSSLRRGIERDRYQAEKLQERGEAALWTPYQRLITGGLPSVAELLKSALVASEGPHTVVLRSCDPDVLAYAGLWGAVNGVAQGQDIRRITRAIAGLIEDQLWGEALEAKDPDQFDKVWKRVKVKQRDPKQRKRALRPLAEKVELEWQRWPVDLSMRVGAFVLNAVLRSGLCTLRKDEEGIARLDLSATAHAAFQDLSLDASWLRPVSMPMCVAPKPWRDMCDGGYQTRRMQEANQLVRGCSRDHRVLVAKALADGTMAPALRALNIVQATPWRINNTMRAIVAEAYTRSLIIEGFPRRELPTLPELPGSEVYETLSTHKQIAFRRSREKVRKRITTLKNQALAFRTDLNTAEALSDLERFWIPHNLDFRGRVYPVPHFNQQRSDYVRALIEFGDGEPLTTEGERWVFIHTANCGDFDKISKRPFDERAAWTEANLDRIVACAEDPFGETWWTGADNPFQFLRACIEIAGLVRARSSGQPGPFVSHLPVSIDGSNSGLQHYSALLRSAEDGQYVNLIPTPVPADIYAEVARRVEARAKVSPDPLAQQWLDFGITRKIVKRNVMTFPYSSAAFGFREQIMVDLMGPLADEVVDKKLDAHPFGEDGGWAAAGYLASEAYNAVTSTVSAATGAMQWFKKVAGALAHEGKGLAYVTPVGFPVLHQYTEYLTKRVTLFLFDRSITVVEAGPRDRVEEEGVYRRVQSAVRLEPTKALMKSRQKSAVSPNIIHSMDGAHLMLTTLAAFNAGVHSFCMIHDSFGTHASHMPKLFRIVREQLAEMYENYDPIDVIYRSAYDALSEKGRKKIEDRPQRGTLDLRQIVNSDFAFA